MSNLIIRLVEHGSAEYWQMVDLRTEVLRSPLGLAFSEAELNAEHQQWHVAAFIDNEVVGTLLMVPKDAQSIKMRQVAVSPKRQGMGLGTRLVSYCEEFCIKKGICKIELHARQGAVKFYEDLAYQKLGESFIEVGIPHYKMLKSWCV